MRTKTQLEHTLKFLKDKDSHDKAAGITRIAWQCAIECVEKELRYYRGCSDVKEFYNEDGELDAPGFQWVSKGEKGSGVEPSVWKKLKKRFQD